MCDRKIFKWPVRLVRFVYFEEGSWRELLFMIRAIPGFARPTENPLDNTYYNDIITVGTLKFSAAVFIPFLGPTRTLEDGRS